MSERITAIFPGQGGLTPGLGEEAYQNSENARATFYEASEIIGEDVAELTFGSQTERILEHAQVVRTAGSLAILEYAKDRKLKISGAGGHSVGQLAALYAVGAFNRQTLFELTHQRQAAMNYANSVNPGGMVSIKTDAVDWLKQLAQSTSTHISNINSSKSFTVSGALHWNDMRLDERVKNFAEWLKDRKLANLMKIRPLGPETGPAHSALQEIAVPLFEDSIDARLHLFKSVPKHSFLSNSVEWLSQPSEFKDELLRALTVGVNWQGQMLEYYKNGFVDFFEPSSSSAKPGILTNLIKDDYKVDIADYPFGSLTHLLIPKAERIFDQKSAL